MLEFARSTGRRYSAALAGLFLAGALCVPASLADGNFDQGVRLYNGHNFGTAVQYFEQSMKSSPGDSSSFYYDALSYQQMGDLTRAKQAYKEVVRRFPGSPAAGLAATALRQLDPGYQQPSVPSPGAAAATGSGRGVSSYGGGASSDLSRLPQETRIYFTRKGNSLIVSAELAHRPMDMIFDTGAEVCVFGKNHLAQAGVSLPQGPPSGYARGVGSSAPIRTWFMNADLKVGAIERKNFPIMVQEELTDPLLGESFFKDFAYTIDNGANSIVLRKKGTTTASGGGANYDVPFSREGNEMIVNVEVNGRACQMIFDTGAESTVVFDKNSLQRAGLSVPDDAQQGLSIGIAGSTKTYTFNCQRVKLGPVDRSDVPVNVVEAGAMGHPLIGQGFYGSGWQYTIDNDNHVIHFLRR